MRSLRQLLRQPGKSLVGFLLVALAIAILITCVGQFTATSLTRANMDDHYSTLALISNDYLWERKPDNTGVRYYDTLPEEYQRWVDETIQARSDLFLQESYSGLLSAYIPALAPDNFSQYAGEPNAYFQRKQQYGAPYRGAMLEVTLTKPGNSLAEDYSYFSATWDGDETALRNSVTYVCLATVERTIALEEGFDPPVGKTILLTITAYCEEDIESMALEEGQRYLVYGMDFSNAHEASFSNLINNTHDAHPGLFQSWFGEVFYSNEGTLDPQTGNWKALLDAEEFAKQIHCTMTVCDYSSLPISTYIDGEFSFRADSRIFYSPNKTIGITVPAEEYVPKYQIPTIAKLTGTAEEFLASPEGALWRQALEEMDISNHSFPVLAVDKLGYQVAFNRGDARITQGRDFTEEERTEGKNVCILSETLANLNGLEIGDTLDLRYTYYDPNIHVQQDSILNNYGAFPSAAYYSRNWGFSTEEPETYTIVGFYRQNNAWENMDDPYGFTPNTIFIPNSSVTDDMATGMLTGGSGIYYTLVLQNGKMEEVQRLQEEAGYPGLLVCMDQGYTEILNGLNSYEGVSSNALYIGVAAYAVVMVLFLALFPFQQRRTLATMANLGANPHKQVQHILISALGILIPGSILGGLAGALVWEQAAARLMASVNVNIPLEANMLLTAPVLTLTHLILMSLLTLLTAIPLTANKNLMRRK